MLVNLSAVVLFSLAWSIRGHADAVPGTSILVLEGMG